MGVGDRPEPHIFADIHHVDHDVVDDRRADAGPGSVVDQDPLGPVRHLASPNKIHHLFLGGGDVSLLVERELDGPALIARLNILAAMRVHNTAKGLSLPMKTEILNSMSTPSRCSR